MSTTLFSLFTRGRKDSKKQQQSPISTHVQSATDEYDEQQLQQLQQQQYQQSPLTSSDPVLRHLQIQESVAVLTRGRSSSANVSPVTPRRSSINIAARGNRLSGISISNPSTSTTSANNTTPLSSSPTRTPTTPTKDRLSRDRLSLRRQSARGSNNIKAGLEALARSGDADAINLLMLRSMSASLQEDFKTAQDIPNGIDEERRREEEELMQILAEKRERDEAERHRLKLEREEQEKREHEKKKEEMAKRLARLKEIQSMVDSDSDDEDNSDADEGGDENKEKPNPSTREEKPESKEQEESAPKEPQQQQETAVIIEQPQPQQPEIVIEDAVQTNVPPTTTVTETSTTIVEEDMADEEQEDTMTSISSCSSSGSIDPSQEIKAQDHFTTGATTITTEETEQPTIEPVVASSPEEQITTTTPAPATVVEISITSVEQSVSEEQQQQEEEEEEDVESQHQEQKLSPQSSKDKEEEAEDEVNDETETDTVTATQQPSSSSSPPHETIDTSALSFQDVLELVRNNDPDLEVLNMKNKSIDDAMLEELVDALESNTTVFELDLDMNPDISDESVPALADLVEFNKHLQVIVFESTNIRTNAEIVCALEKNFVLRDLVLSQHATDDELNLVDELLDRNENARA